MSDLGSLLAFGLLLLAVVATGEVLRARLGWLAESSRRVVHTLTGLAVVAAVPHFASPGPLYLLAALFVGINLVSVGKGYLPGMHAIRRKSIGTVTFPLALIVALFTCWTLDPSRIYIIQIAFVVLALSDPLASIAGGLPVRVGRYVMGENERSIAGSGAFFLSAWLLIGGGMALLPGHGLAPGEVLIVAFIVAALATGAEALAPRGWDNFFIVVAAVVPLAWLHQFPGALPALILGASLALLFALAAYQLRFLTADGALAAAGLAFSVVAFGGWAWAAPAFTFFMLSSLLSKLGRRRKLAAEALAEKGSTRDAGQVYANGGIAWLLLLAHAFAPGSALLYWAFAGAFAAAAADTWGTEIGTLVRGRTHLVWSGRQVPPGSSGGVSVAGTLAAAAGAAVVFASLVPFAGGYLDGIGWATAAAVVVGGGVAASLVDSLLGATVQGLYRDPSTGRLTERAASAVAHARVRGWHWVTNDRVNLICTLSGAAIPAVALLLH